MCSRTCVNVSRLLYNERHILPFFTTTAEVHSVFGLQRRAVRIISSLSYRDGCGCMYVGFRLLAVSYLFWNVCYTLRKMGAQTHEDVQAYNTRPPHNLVSHTIV